MNLDLYSIPVGEKFLVYAPLHGLAALVNEAAAGQVRLALETGATPDTPAVRAIALRLQETGVHAPQPRLGPLENPYFLGLIPTRGCNLGCRYCDFPASKQGSPVMPLSLARQAIDAYYDLLLAHGQPAGAVHFFGGEPFYAAEVVYFAVHYALEQAARRNLGVRCEVTTNGVGPEKRWRWAADHFDAVVLSLDGPPDIQDRQRPALSGRSAAQAVVRNARILSEGPADLVLRTCITQDTVGRMAEIAAWFVQEFRPTTVCFEALSPSPRSQAAGLAPPDPWAFARNFIQAARFLQAQGIEATNSTGGLHGPQATCCPVGKDALIVSPDGSVDACYLLPADWRRRGLEMRLGRLDGQGFEIDPQALQRVRQMTVHARPQCAGCLCRYHCAGGCPVRHPASASAGDYDDLCLRTRAITIACLLERLGSPAEVNAWLADQQALEKAVCQADDRLLAGGRAA